MPRKNKGKKNKRAPIDEEEDWNSNPSEEEQDALKAAKELVGKNKKKKNKKNKGKNKYQQDNDDNDDDWNDNDSSKQSKKKNKKNKGKNKQQQHNDDDDDDWNDDDSPKQSNKNKKKNKKNKNKKYQPSNEASDDDQPPPQQQKKLSKKEKKRLKKLQKQQQEESPEPDWDLPESDDEPQQQRGNKKNKKKKNKKNKGKQYQQDEDDEDDGWNDNKSKKNKKNKKNKNKRKNKQRNEEEERLKRLLKLKEERQEALLSYGTNIMLDLDIKYAPYLDDEIKEAWEDQIGDFVQFYEDNPDQVEDEELLNEKKKEMKAAWSEIFLLIEEDYEADSVEREKKKKLEERQKKIAELAKQGIHIKAGGGDDDNQQKSKLSLKQQKKREEKERLKAARARLMELDRLQKEKEEKEKQEQKEQQALLEKKRKEQEEAKKKEQEKAKANKNDNWDDSSDDDEEEEGVPVKKGKKKGGRGGGGKGKNNKNTVPQKKVKDDNWDDSSDDDKPQKRKKKKADNWDDSDDESQNKQQSKKKGRSRGGRKKNKNNQNQQNQQKQKQQQQQQSKTQSQSPPNANKQQKEKPKVASPKSEETKESDQNRGGKKKGKKGKQGKHNKKNKKEKVELRSPICVVMGHVDTGKTKILDHIRKTSVQDKEAGGITQQIGATYLSVEYIKERTARLKEQVAKLKYKIPGLLFIDTPGHESFSNLRSRGSSMCDIAVLVVDLMHGLEPQTIESLKMLQSRKAPFIVALNKIDVCYDWRPDKDAPFLTTYNKQSKHTKNDFEKRLQAVKVEFAENGVNAEIYNKNKNLKKDVSLVPTSAITGEGIPDLLYLIVQLTKKYMESKIAFSMTNFKCSVLEVKQTVGYGATIDVILANGKLEAADTIVACGMNGPIVTGIRALLLPHEAQEMRVKGEYRTVKEVVASAGVRIACHESLETAVAGSPLFIVPRDLKHPKFAQKRKGVIEDLKDEVQRSFADLFSKIDRRNRGVYVQASTLGSLEALIGFLSDQKIPICGIGLGTISKQNVMKAGVMLEFQKEYAVILAFNVKVAPDARKLATEMGVRLFEAEIIYHLQEMFENYIKELKEQKKAAAKDVAVFPVEMKILSPEHVFRNKNPLLLGVQITRGTLRKNTPIVAQRWNDNKIAIPMFLGRVDGIQIDKKEVDIAKMGDKASVRIQGDDSTKNVQVGRSFLITDPLISEISRDSLDALKDNFEDEIKEKNDTVKHLMQLKKYFGII